LLSSSFQIVALKRSFCMDSTALKSASLAAYSKARFAMPGSSCG
jgi:hypothetical protein